MDKNINTSSFKEIFLYFFAFATLCYSVWHFISIGFEIINTLIKDKIDYASYSYMSPETFRFSAASLLVIFPIFVVISWYISRSIEANNSLAELKVRAVFIWLSISASVITIAGSLISAVYYFLGGEFTTRFCAKLLLVLLVAVLIGGYYVYSLRRDYKVKSKYSLYMIVAALVLVFSIVVYGIYTLGTPGEIRKRKMDGQRYGLLNSLTGGVASYLNQNKALPANTEAINSPDYRYDSGYVLVDPVSGEHLKYKAESNIANNWQYQVCVNFETEHIRNVNTDYQYYQTYNTALNLDGVFNNDSKPYRATVTGDDMRKGHHIGENCMSVRYTLGTSTTPVKAYNVSEPIMK